MNQSNNTGDVSLFCILLGCTPKGRNIEQHDIMFGVANKLQDLTDDMKNFWYNNIIDEVSASLKKQLPGLDNQQFSASLHKALSRRDKVHVDAWMKVEYAGNYKVVIRPKSNEAAASDLKLYFINLGGYRENEFEEFHKKLFVAATSVNDALQQVMHHPFMKEHSPAELGIAGAGHLDDKHQIDFEADDIVCVSESLGDKYELLLEKTDSPKENEMAIGYVRLEYSE